MRGDPSSRRSDGAKRQIDEEEVDRLALYLVGAELIVEV